MIEAQERAMKDLTGRVEDLTRKNSELELISISLCRRTHTLVYESENQEERRHLQYLAARGYGNVIQPQMAYRSGGPPKKRRREVSGDDSELSDYKSDA